MNSTIVTETCQLLFLGCGAFEWFRVTTFVRRYGFGDCFYKIASGACSYCPYGFHAICCKRGFGFRHGVLHPITWISYVSILYHIGNTMSSFSWKNLRLVRMFGKNSMIFRLITLTCVNYTYICKFCQINSEKSCIGWSEPPKFRLSGTCFWIR